MKLGELVNAYPSIVALSQVKLQANVAFRIADAIDSSSGYVNRYHSCRNDLLKEMGTPNDDGSSFTFDSNESMDAFIKSEKSLLDEEVNITLPKIKRKELGDAKVEATHLLTLKDIMIVEDSDV